MPGTLKIALKLLVNDKSKFTALLVGITFEVFIMVMMMSMFSGILTRSSSSVYNIGARIRVMDPAVNNATSSITMSDYILSTDMSIKGVKYAVPSTLFTTSFSLIEPKNDLDILFIKKKIRKFGDQALTRAEFVQKITKIILSKPDIPAAPFFPFADLTGKAPVEFKQIGISA